LKGHIHELKVLKKHHQNVKALLIGASLRLLLYVYSADRKSPFILKIYCGGHGFIKLSLLLNMAYSGTPTYSYYTRYTSFKLTKNQKQEKQSS